MRRYIIENIEDDEYTIGNENGEGSSDFYHIIQEEIDRFLYEEFTPSRNEISYQGREFDFTNHKNNRPFVLTAMNMYVGDNQDTHEEAVTKELLKKSGKPIPLTKNGFLNMELVDARNPYLLQKVQEIYYGHAILCGRIFYMEDGVQLICLDFEKNKITLKLMLFKLQQKGLIDINKAFIRMGEKEIKASDV